MPDSFEGRFMPHGFDNPTLIVSQMILFAIYTGVFYFIHRAYPQVKGVRYFIWAFLVAIFARAAFALDGILTLPILASLGNCLALANQALVYSGLIENLGERGVPLFAWSSIAVAMLINVTVSLAHGETIVAVGAAGISFAVIRALIAIELFRHSSRVWVVRVFAIFMALFAVYSMNQTVLKIPAVRDAFSNAVPGISLQTVFLLINVACSALVGIFLIFLIGNSILNGVERETLTDPLTEKLNRRGIEQRINNELTQFTKEGVTFSVAIIDLDHFKTINDTWGHAAGDMALCLATNLVTSHTRSCDDVGRLGGDELVVILPSTNAEQALAIADRICRSILSSTILGERLLSASIGVAQSERMDSTATILARADSALYEAKKAGRGCVRYQPLLADTQKGISSDVIRESLEKSTR
jgi:diguanylate cyclase (GGDEF)-like protein